MAQRLSRRRLLAVSATAPIALAGRAWAGSAAQDPIPQPQRGSRDRVATVGIVAGQLARLSVFYPSDPENFPEDPENFRVNFFAIDGKLLATGDGRVMPGQGAFLDFDLSPSFKRGQRLQVHCNVTLPEGYENEIGATLELFDAKTGETAIASRPDIIPRPYDNMTMGTIGVVNGQVARLSVFRHVDPEYHSDPEPYKIEIHGLDGTLLASDSGIISPGHGAFYDYPLAATARKSERIQFHAAARMIAGHEMGALVEVIDAKTSVTQFVATPASIEEPRA